MGIVYALSIILLAVCFILIKKTEKKLDILAFIPLTIVITFCYNTLVCYILTFFTIKCSLINLTIVNLLFIVLLLIPILKKKQIQSYEIRKTDLIYIALIAVTVIGLAIKNFGIPFNIKYETSDPSVHYLTSVMFAENDSLLGSFPDEVYGSLEVRKTASYVNSGLLMEILCPELNAIDCYHVFVCFGIFILFMTGWTFFSSLMNFVKDKKMQLIAFIITIICILGYPLNSFLFGFEYLSMGLLIICAIISMVTFFEEKEFKRYFGAIIFALLNFGLFSAYYMFVPFIYPALGIYFIIHDFNKYKKLITVKNILFLTITLLIPFFLGYIYHLAPQIYRILINNTGLNTSTVMNYSSSIINTGLSVYGYIYINLYSNMIILLPLTIYLALKHIKENKFMALAVGLCVAFIELLLVGHLCGKVSMYYLQKNYFVLWILLLYCNFKALVKLNEKNKLIPVICTFGYVTIMIIYTIFSHVKVKDTSAISNPDENLLTVMEIFGSNKTMLDENPQQLNQKEIELIMYAKENLDKTKRIEVVADHKQYYWTYVLLRYFNHEEFTYKYYGQPRLNAKIYQLKKNISMKNFDYIVYLNRSEAYKLLEDILFDDCTMVYENESGGILKYNN